MLNNTFGLIVCVFVAFCGLRTVFRIFKEEKAFNKRYKELLEKEKLLNDLQSQICSVSNKEFDTSNQDL